MGPVSSLAALFGSAFLLITGSGLMTTLIPLTGKLDGFPALWIGLIGSSYFAGMLLGTFGAPIVIRRAGYVGAFASFIVIAAMSAVAFPTVVHPVAWLLLRGIVGFVFAGLYAVIEGWLSARSKDANRARIYAVYQIMTFSGSAAGQQILRLGSDHVAPLFLTSAACFALAIIPLLVFHAVPPQRPSEVRVRLAWFFRASPIGAVAAFCIGAANGSYYALAPVYGLGLGLSRGEVATFMTAATIGTALAIYPIAYFADGHDRRRVIALFAVLGAAAEFLLARVDSGAGLQMWGLAMAMGATSFVLYMLAFAHANARIETERSVIVSSAMLFLYCVGAVAAPVVASGLMAWLGVTALFVQNGVVHVALALFVVWRMFRRPAARAAVRPTMPASDAAGKPVPGRRLA